MGLAEYVGKKYKLSTSENFDEYMKALGKYTFYVKSILIVEYCAVQIAIETLLTAVCYYYFSRYR